MKKITKMFSSLLVLVLLLSISLSMPVAAEEDDASAVHCHIDVDTVVLFPDNPSEHFQDCVIADLQGKADGGASTDGLLCTLFGHNFESSTVVTITHKARTTAPRCLRRTYDYEICSRCDYTEVTLMSSVYIYCCS